MRGFGAFLEWKGERKGRMCFWWTLDFLVCPYDTHAMLTAKSDKNHSFFGVDFCVCDFVFVYVPSKTDGLEIGNNAT